MKTILIVDDLPIFREPIEGVLRREGFATLSASNGREALGIMRSQVPDLVILDLGLPSLDGLEVLARMRESPQLANVPVIVLSVESERSRIVAAARLGISGYMLKAHFSLQGLLDRVAQQLKDKVPQTPKPAGPVNDTAVAAPADPAAPAANGPVPAAPAIVPVETVTPPSTLP